ncbi:hypothetical protein TMRO357_00528 [Alteriqipengyuania sp. 357]
MIGTTARALGPLVDFVYPPRCPLCGEGVAAGPGLCADCWAQLGLPGEPGCARCQIPLPSAAVESVCGSCSAHPPRHAGIAAAALYNEAARQLVLRYKHGKRIGLAKLMGRLIASKLSDAPAHALLVPVPLHPRRLWGRGFNQAALLAQAIAHQTGHVVLVDGLRRTRATPKLGGLGRVARARMLRDAIAVSSKAAPRIRGSDMILVDDVLTSGATSSACTAALLDAGARSVRIACFARVADPKSETPGT